MSTEANPKGHWEPIHDAHAIEQVAFVLQMAQPIEEAPFARAREVAKQFKNESDLPGQRDIQRLAFSFGAQTPLPPPSVPLVLQRISADGTPEKELKIDSESITFKTFRYTRWNEAWLQARRYFEELVPIYAASGMAVGISLNYIDKFKWAGNLNECKTNLLLRHGSNYLCPHIFESDDFWHSHTGAFIRTNQTTKRLLNVNVDYLDEIRPDETQRIVAITTVLTDLMNQPGYDETEVNANNAINLLDGRMQELHLFGKKVFSNIISDDMCKRIALI